MLRRSTVVMKFGGIARSQYGGIMNLYIDVQNVKGANDIYYVSFAIRISPN